MSGKSSKGFTLVEMLIVIVIIGILASTLIPRIMGSMMRARDTARISNTRQLGQGVQIYVADYGTVPSSAGTGYKSIENISGVLSEYIKSIPTDKGNGLVVNSNGECKQEGDYYSYYGENNRGAITAIMEGGRGNAPTCHGIISSENVFGKHSDGYNMDLGTYSKAMSFDGVDDYVDINITMPAYPYTISTRVSIDQINSNSKIIGSDNSNYQGLSLLNGKAIWYFDPSNFNYFQGQPLNINKWYHLVTVVNSAKSREIKMYMNGSSAPGTYGHMTDGSPLENLGRIGHHGFSGSISNVRIYDRSLSDSEVTQLYQKSDIKDGLVAHYKLDEIEGDTIYDSSGNGHHGVLHGMSEQERLEQPDEYIFVN